MPPEDNDDAPEIRARSFWSGTITFGLVSIPVDLFPANRSQRVSLRMLDEDGTPLSRRYYCPRTNSEVDYEHLVRGYEIEPGKFVAVTDEELEALEPQKSREIDLRHFVPTDDIDPLYFRRGYFFAPTETSGKAYRLLADIMERTGRAGIATFVMRGKEYLVAILATDGILRAETLRFQDEIRSPDELELPDEAKPDSSAQRRFERAIKKRSANKLSTKELEDEQAQRIHKLAERKQRRHEDVVAAPDELVEEGSEGKVIDLMQVLKERLTASQAAGGAGATRKTGTSTKRKTGAKTQAKREAGAGARKKTAGAEELDTLGKDELYARAQELDIAGRSGMSKVQLIQAIRQASTRRAA